MSGGEQRFARDAAHIKAIAAHVVPLDERGLHAELRRARGDGQSGRSGRRSPANRNQASRARHLRQTTGSNDSTASASSGPRIGSENKILRSGFPPWLNTPPIPRADRRRNEGCRQDTDQRGEDVRAQSHAAQRGRPD